MTYRKQGRSGEEKKIDHVDSEFSLTALHLQEHWLEVAPLPDTNSVWLGNSVLINPGNDFARNWNGNPIDIIKLLLIVLVPEGLGEGGCRPKINQNDVILNIEFSLLKWSGNLQDVHYVNVHPLISVTCTNKLEGFIDLKDVDLIKLISIVKTHHTQYMSICI